MLARITLALGVFASNALTWGEVPRPLQSPLAAIGDQSGGGERTDGPDPYCCLGTETLLGARTPTDLGLRDAENLGLSRGDRCRRPAGQPVWATGRGVTTRGGHSLAVDDHLDQAWSPGPSGSRPVTNPVEVVLQRTRGGERLRFRAGPTLAGEDLSALCGPDSSPLGSNPLISPSSVDRPSTDAMNQTR